MESGPHESSVDRAFADSTILIKFLVCFSFPQVTVDALDSQVFNCRTLPRAK